MATATTTTVQPAGVYARWTPSLPSTLLGLLNAFAPTDNPKPADQDATPDTNNADPHQHPRSTLTRSAIPALPVNQIVPGPPSPSRSIGSIMFAEPDTRSNSESGSREGSVDELRRIKRSSRSKTQFSVCHPPPESRVRQKIHRRPRSLLQFHRLSAHARPRPALEVIPSANFSVRLTRAITKVFRAKHGLCPDDLVVLKAERYSDQEADEDQEARDVIGLICKGRLNEDRSSGGKARIHMASGKEWEAYATANGGYEFFSQDGHGLGLTARWVPKRSKDGSKLTTKDGKRRFNFSTISPNSRRHPIIASLSSTALDINDTYKIPDATATTPLSTPKQTNTILEDAMDEEEAGPGPCDTNDQLREIITMTAIWVTFKEGWSPSFKYDEKEASAIPLSPGKNVASPITSPPGSPGYFPLEKRASIRSIGSGLIRRTSILSKSNRSSVISMQVDDEPPAPSRSASIGKPGRSRADSSSTVLVHRAASNRRKNNQQAAWRPDFLAAQDRLQETSREDLSRDVSFPTAKKKQSPLAVAVAKSKSPKRHDSTTDGLTTPTPRSRTLSQHRASTATTTTITTNASTSSMPAKKSNKRHLLKILCGRSSDCSPE